MAHTTDTSAVFPSAARVLRCRKSHRYFTGEGWTTDPDDAQIFIDDLDAARACVANDLHDVELVLRAKVSGTEFFSTPVR